MGVRVAVGAGPPRMASANNERRAPNVRVRTCRGAPTVWITTDVSVRGACVLEFPQELRTKKDRYWRSSCPVQTNSPRNNYGRQPRCAR